MIFNKRTAACRKLPSTGTFYTAAVKRDNVTYTLRRISTRHDRRNRYILELYALNHNLEVFKIARQTGVVSTLTLSDKYAIVDNPDSLELHVYNRGSGEKTIIKTPHSLGGICLLPDESLLAVGKHCLIRYRVEADQLIEVWRCDRLRFAYSVAFNTSDGLVYVWSMHSMKTIHVVSLEGKTSLCHCYLFYVCRLSLSNDLRHTFCGRGVNCY